MIIEVVIKIFRSFQTIKRSCRLLKQKSICQKVRTNFIIGWIDRIFGWHFTQVLIGTGIAGQNAIL